MYVDGVLRYDVMLLALGRRRWRWAAEHTFPVWD